MKIPFLSKPEQPVRPTWEEQRRQAASDELGVLATISSNTDPLAEQALLICKQLPPDESLIFMKNIMREVVVQTLHNSNTLDQSHSNFYRSIHGYGADTVKIDSYFGGTLADNVIKKSLPNYEQESLNF